jgi:2-polyprenyl-3-methyl-5-hydroxy-6-metoxy-1,4-benzoquinol methylase
VPRPEEKLKARFDAAYYRRFYESPRTRVQGPRDVDRLARALMAILAWMRESVEDVLDVGAGTGLWRDWFRRRGISCRSVDVSEYACREYGHEQRDIARWRADETFDLVVCQGVLPYLSDADAASAIRNLARMCGGFLYLEAITERDWRTVCDRNATDSSMRLRPAAWYRKRLTKHFVPLGFGLWMRRGRASRLYELERGE